jgi:thiol-disulfide isomerase/thioredoxin
LADQSADPARFLESCWATGGVLHHQHVTAYLLSKAAANPAWFPEVEHLAIAGALDPDMSVRELALGTLRARKDPLLYDCARAQFKDPDPLVRRLGLQYLERVDSPRAVPAVIALLDDPDLKVRAAAEVELMRWTGEDFGVRNALAISGEAAARPGPADAANLERIRQGIEHRKQWWRDHAQEFPASPDAINTLVIAEAPTAKRVADFKLRDLDGRAVGLAQFRGKTVVLNFWATWCTACVAEIPDLIALHKELGDKVVVLGVALDGLPDEDGDVQGAAGGASSRSLDGLREIVRRTVKSRGIDYPVLPDPDGVVAKRFNGGELPTTVIIDAAGRMRRRFIGERDVKVFEAMIEAAGAGK